MHSTHNTQDVHEGNCEHTHQKWHSTGTQEGGDKENARQNDEMHEVPTTEPTMEAGSTEDAIMDDSEEGRSWAVVLIRKGIPVRGRRHD